MINLLFNLPAGCAQRIRRYLNYSVGRFWGFSPDRDDTFHQ